MSWISQHRITENIVPYKNVTTKTIGLSSEICEVALPSYTITNSGKIVSGVTSGDVNVIISDELQYSTNITFHGNLSAFNQNNLDYFHEIYKFNNDISGFDINSKKVITYSEPLTSNTLTIHSDYLTYDNEYLIKTRFSLDSCSEMINERYTTSNRYGDQFGLYDGRFDQYFIFIKNPDKPTILTSNDSSDQTLDNLRNITFIVSEDGNTLDIKLANINEDFVITLNGLVLSNGWDFTYSGTIITFNDKVLIGDIVNLIYISSPYEIKFYSEVYDYELPINSGSTDTQSASDKLFFNTDKNKFEFFLDYDPSNFNDFILSLNGVTLAKNIDYYQSRSNPRRIIINGLLILNDLLNVFYITDIPYIGGINSNTINVSWNVTQAPIKDNGYFVLEVSNDKSFSSITYSAITNYIVGVNGYNNVAEFTGDVGEQRFYRIKNVKNYETILGEIITIVNYSDIITVVIGSNDLNNY